MNIDLKRGAFIFLIGIPIFFVLRTILEFMFEREISWSHNLIWTLAIASIFGLISTFYDPDSDDEMDEQQ